MPSDHFGLWQEYHSVYPIDGSREDLRHGILCRLICSAFAGEQSDVMDWIPTWKERPVVEDLEAFKAGFLALVAK